MPISTSAYNKWHETELERWLSDHAIPYPKPADRKDIEDLVAKNWKEYVVEPYRRWSPAELSSFLAARGKDVKAGADETVENLIESVKSNWYGSEDAADRAATETKDWIFETWSDSQLKALCDRQGIPGKSCFDGEKKERRKARHRHRLTIARYSSGNKQQRRASCKGSSGLRSRINCRR